MRGASITTGNALRKLADEIQTFIRHLSTPSALDLTPSSFENLLSLKNNHKNIEYHTVEPKLEFKNIGLGL